MLQIILAIIGISMVSIIGFVTIEMLAIQSIAQDQRENVRRLDVAATSLQGRLGRLPGVDNLLAPLGIEGGSYYQLPVGVGALNSNIEGVPFLYCPLANLSNESLLSVPGAENEPISMPDASYDIRHASGFVVSSSLAVDSNISQLNPVAFIISAGRSVDTPPSCANVQFVNGRAVVPNGLVRVVSLPSGVASTDNGLTGSVEFFVAPEGSGDGTRINSPTTIDAALQHFTRYLPSNMTIHILDNVVPSNTVWSSFVAASANSGASLRINGLGTDSRLISGSDGVWTVPASTVFENVAIVGPQIIVGSGDRLLNIGLIEYFPSGSPAQAVLVNTGGEFLTRDATIRFTIGGNAISNNGTLDIRRSTLFGNGITSYINLNDGSELSLSTSLIGTNTFPPSLAAIRSNNPISVTSDSASIATPSSSGVCWSGLANDLTFRFSTNGSGGNSIVVSETGFPPPAAGATAAEIQAYNTGFNERQRARQINGSNISCT